ncbi:MAG: TonB-dependent receptor [Candidatus Aminicenantes bacterium]|nr:TonB-dependent receptor [Candidatus Aminicenantes bacterium]
MKKTIVKAVFILFISAALLFSQSRKKLSVNELMKLDLEKFLNVEVISASKKSEKLFTAPATVYVITEEEIERLGFLHLQDALSYIPSVYLYNPHSWVWGGQRGLVSNFSQTLLLINGREVNNLIAQEGFISRQFATHNIKRIEIMASPGSALYGANALAGVINVITKDSDPEFEGIELSFSGGSYNTTSAALVFGKTFRDLSIGGSIRLFSSDEANFLDFVRDKKNYSPGWSDNSLANQFINEYKNPSESLPFNFKVTYKNIYFGLTHYYNKQSQGLEKLRWDYTDGEDNRNFTMAFAGIDQKITEKIKIKIEYQHTWSYMWGRYHSGLWPVSRLESNDNFDIYTFPDEVITSTGEILHGESEIIDFYESFAHYLVDQGILDPDSITPEEIQKYFTHIYTNKNSRGSQRKHFDILCTWALSPVSTIDIGYVFDNIDYVGLAVTDAAFGIGGGYDIPVNLSLRKDSYDSVKHGIYLQFKSSFFSEKLKLHFGCRYDHQNIYGGTLNPRVGMVWQPSGNDIFKVLYGEAFREPNVFELSSNPDVKPAKLRSFEVNYSRQFGELAHLGFTVYVNDVSDYLSSVGALIGSGIGKVEKQNIKGVEFQFRLKKKPLIAFVNGAYLFDITQDIKSNTTGETDTYDVPGIPEIKLNLGVSYNVYKNLTLSFLYSFFDEYQALSGNSAIIDPFMISSAHNLRLNLYWSSIKLAGSQIDLTLTVNNLTNAKNYHANIRRSGPHMFLQEGRNFILSVRIRN